MVFRPMESGQEGAEPMGMVTPPSAKMVGSAKVISFQGLELEHTIVRHMTDRRI